MPGRRPESSRGGFRNLPVESRIGKRQVLLLGESYASNVALKEQRSHGLEVWFAGKTGYVYLQSVPSGTTATRGLARFCELTGNLDATNFSL